MNQLTMLEQLLQTLAQETIKSGDTQFANMYKCKSLGDCANAIMTAMFVMASDTREGKNCCGINPSNNVLASAMVHWYTEDKPTTESIVDILKGEYDHMAMNVSKPTSATPKASTPKATPKKESKPKATAPTTAPAPAPAVPTQAPKPAPVIQIVPPAPPVAEVEDDDDDFDPLA